MHKGSNNYAQAVALLSKTNENFLEVASLLAHLRYENREQFERLIVEGHIGRRKAQYLIWVDFVAFAVNDDERLKRIGWTKLAIIARFPNVASYKELLTFAETHSVRDLALVLAGKPAQPRARCMLLYFTLEEYELVERVLWAFDAKKRGKGLVDKEPALLAALTKAVRSFEVVT